LRCEKVDDFFLLRDGAAGLFLAASKFPKNRETRAPKVIELAPHRAEIDPKYRFLLDAPARDPEGNPAIVRYSRKTAEHYVQTEKDGKASGWKASYKDGRWVESRGEGGEAQSARAAPAKKATASKKAPAKKAAAAKRAPAKKAPAKATAKPKAKKG
jgi:DNA topoisomerase-1